MDPTLEFAQVVARPEPQVDLERAALLIAAHARPGLDVAAEVAALDALAEGCDEDGLDAVRRHLFGRLGFRGNPDDYYDPANSYLDHVRATRRGIPISLSVLTMSVARRRGAELVGVGMPGHFLVRSAVDPDLFVDPYGGGALLAPDGARDLFHSLHGAEAAFTAEMLAPVGAHAIVTRMLNNLVAVFTARRDAQGRLWALRLRADVPGVALEDRAEVASALAALGEFAEAARWLEALSLQAPAPLAATLRAGAERARSRLN
jgi:regulator of sirC expression with transglutaminase-like and TPR domain